jgi:polysaccharide biosynthesis protein PslH
MKILFVSRWYPYPVDNGSKIRIYNLIRILAKSHSIDLISFSSEKVSEERIAAMKQYCQDIKTAEYRVKDEYSIRWLKSFLLPQPRSMTLSHSHEMQKFIEEADCSASYDVVISSQLDMAAYTHPWHSSPKIFEEIELTTLYEKFSLEHNPFVRTRRYFMWLKYKQYVNNLLKCFKSSTVVSELERRRVQLIAPEYKNVEVVPNGIDTTYLSGDFGELEPNSLVYSGALSYYANLDAMEYFIGEILPLIQQKIPNVKLYITGSVAGIEIDKLQQNSGVIFTGYLEDIRPRIAKSLVSIVPLRIGGGTRLKILESLALKTPVVSTVKGAEGLDLVGGKDLLIADHPEDFAAAVIKVLRDPALRNQLGIQGCEAVRQTYDWQTVGEKLNKVLENMV